MELHHIFLFAKDEATARDMIEQAGWFAAILTKAQSGRLKRFAGSSCNGKGADFSTVPCEIHNVSNQIGSSDVAFSVETTMDVRNFRTFLSAKKNRWVNASYPAISLAITTRMKSASPAMQ